MSFKDVLSASMRSSGFVFLVLGGIFLLVGFPLFVAGAFPVYDHYRSGSWKSTPAYVEKLDWHEEDGEDSILYKVTGIYRYQWGSETYRCERITSETGSSSDRKSWQDIFDALSRSRDSGAPIMVLVDPEAPSQAIAVRKMTTGLLLLPIIGFFFAGLGFSFLVGGIWSIIQQKAPADPQRPWIGTGPWDGFQVRSGDWKDVIIAWVIAIFVAGFESIIFFAIYGEGTLPFVVYGILGVFLLAAVGLIFRAFYMSMRRMKYGDSILLLSQIPLVPGREFDGVVLTKRSLNPENGCKATLRCIAVVRKESSDSDNNTTFSEETRYEKSVIVRADLGRTHGNRSAIPVHFDIPGHIPPRFLEDYPQIRWKLALEAETPGIDFFAEFELPVYAVQDDSLIQLRNADV